MDYSIVSYFFFLLKTCFFSVASMDLWVFFLEFHLPTRFLGRKTKPLARFFSEPLPTTNKEVQHSGIDVHICILYIYVRMYRMSKSLGFYATHLYFFYSVLYDICNGLWELLGVQYSLLIHCLFELYSTIIMEHAVCIMDPPLTHLTRLPETILIV